MTPEAKPNNSIIERLLQPARTGQLIGKGEFLRLLDNRELLIEPLLDRDAQVGTLGVDLRLDCFFREFGRTRQPIVTPALDSHATFLREVEPFRDRFYLQPGEFALGQSLEYLALPNTLLGLLNGRSSLGRRGLIVHATANFVDPGWHGHLVFELANLGSMPLELMPLLRVARLVFMRTRDVGGYSGSYSAQTRITPPQPDPLAIALSKLGKENA